MATECEDIEEASVTSTHNMFFLPTTHHCNTVTSMNPLYNAYAASDPRLQPPICRGARDTTKANRGSESLYTAAAFQKLALADAVVSLQAAAHSSSRTATAQWWRPSG